MIQQLTIATRLKACQATAKRLFGDEYPERIQKYKVLIRKKMEDDELEVLTATLAVEKEMKELSGDGMGVMLLMAAAVDMVEDMVEGK